MWMWLALIFLIASAASVTGISALLKNLFVNTIGSGTISGGLTVVLAVKLLGLLLLVVRGLLEVRYSRLAVVTLLIQDVLGPQDEMTGGEPQAFPIDPERGLAHFTEIAKRLCRWGCSAVPGRESSCPSI